MSAEKIHGESTDVAATSPTSPNRLGYRPELDGIRAVAVLGVMVHHANVQVLIGGHAGVSVFFTLSGFLITTLLLQERQLTGRVDLLAFYTRRAARLLPALVVTLVVTSVLTILAFRGDAVKSVVFAGGAALFYSANIVALTMSHTLPHLLPFGWAWSLSMEEQFYLVWPVILVLALRRRAARSWLLSIAVAGIAFSIWQKFHLTFANGWNDHLYVGPDTRMDALLFGCVLALCLNRRSGQAGEAVGRLSRVLAGAAGCAGLVLVIGVYHYGLVEDDRTYRLALPAIALGTCALILAGLFSPSSPVSRLLRTSLLVRLGQVSYGLYLWNFVLLYFWQHWQGQLLTHRQAVAWFAATWLVAELSYRFIEMPLIGRSRRYLRAREARRPAGPPQARGTSPASTSTATTPATRAGASGPPSGSAR